MKYTLLSVLLLGTILTIFSSCKKEDHNVPYTYVDIYIRPNSTQYFDLNSVGGWVYLTGGVRGILVYRSGLNSFMTYDRACPFDYPDACAYVEVEASGLRAVDSCCNSVYLLLDGSNISGPATQPLKQYRNHFDGEILHIYN